MIRKKIISVIVVIILITNITPFAYFFKDNYTFSNYNGEFYANELGGKGRSFSGIKEGFKNYINKHPDDKDKQLYRTFILKPWRFWEWHEWVVHFKRFTLPYLSEKQIQENRRKERLPQEY